MTGERREDLVGECTRAAQRSDLLGVLHRAQALDETARRLCVDACVHERPVERVREVLLLEADAPAREKLADRRKQPARDLDDLQAGK